MCIKGLIMKKKAEFEVNVDPLLHSVITNFVLFRSLQEIIICKTCKGNIKFSKRNEKGLGFQLVVSCKCVESNTQSPNNSSPKIQTSYEIYRRIVFAMRLLDVGLKVINIFCALMDIGKDYGSSSYYSIINHI